MDDGYALMGLGAYLCLLGVWGLAWLSQIKRSGVRTRAEVIRKDRIRRPMVLCGYRTADGRAIASERRVSLQFYNSADVGSPAEIVFLPPRPTKWVPVIDIGGLRLNAIGTIALGLALCLVGAMRTG